MLSSVCLFDHLNCHRLIGSFLVVTQSKWSVLQIVLPIITALVAFLVTFIAMHLHHTRLQRTSWRQRLLHLVRPIPRVKNVDKYESWEIEANDGAQYELAVPQGGRADTYAFGPNSPQQLQAQHPFHRGGHSRADSETFDEDEAGWGLKNVRLPWKKGPKDLNKVQEVHATTEFDIDDYNASSATVGLSNDAESIYSQRRPPSQVVSDLLLEIVDSNILQLRQRLSDLLSPSVRTVFPTAILFQSRKARVDDILDDLMFSLFSSLCVCDYIKDLVLRNRTLWNDLEFSEKGSLL